MDDVRVCYVGCIDRMSPCVAIVVLKTNTRSLLGSHYYSVAIPSEKSWFASHRTIQIMAETNGADAAAKKVVMVTGGTGLVGCGIKEFVASDPEVRCLAAFSFSSIMGENCRRAAGKRGERQRMEMELRSAGCSPPIPHYR